jgi:putative FmdB family regulatory protein
MPVYDYKCREHGLFHQLATMEDCAKPAECPTCQALSPRVIVLPPEIAAMDPAKRSAQDRNERSKHEPVFSTADRRAHDGTQPQVWVRLTEAGQLHAVLHRRR